MAAELRHFQLAKLRVVAVVAPSVVAPVQTILYGEVQFLDINW